MRSVRPEAVGWGSAGVLNLDLASRSGPNSGMSNMLSNLSLAQLRRAVDLREKIETLQNEFNQLLESPAQPRRVGRPPGRTTGRVGRPPGRRNDTSTAALPSPRQLPGNGTTTGLRPQSKKKLSAAARMALSAAAKARWKKAKAAGKSTL